jgi:hypothetical protein
LSNKSTYHLRFRKQIAAAEISWGKLDRSQSWTGEAWMQKKRQQRGEQCKSAGIDQPAALRQGGQAGDGWKKRDGRPSRVIPAQRSSDDSRADVVILL